MGDERIRALAQAASTGDRTAARSLLVALDRAGAKERDHRHCLHHFQADPSQIDQGDLQFGTRTWSFIERLRTCCSCPDIFILAHDVEFEEKGCDPAQQVVFVALESVDEDTGERPLRFVSAPVGAFDPSKIGQAESRRLASKLGLNLVRNNPIVKAILDRVWRGHMHSEEALVAMVATLAEQVNVLVNVLTQQLQHALNAQPLSVPMASKSAPSPSEGPAPP